MLMFLAVYRVVPNTPLGLADVWKGATLAGVLFVLLNQVFPLYLRLFGGGFEAYKTLGLLLLLMTWLYFLARILVLGAELNAFLGAQGHRLEATLAQPSADARRLTDRSPTDGKLILWAGLSAGVTGLTLAAARRTAAGVWRAIMREEPPRTT